MSHDSAMAALKDLHRIHEQLNADEQAALTHLAGEHLDAFDAHRGHPLPGEDVWSLVAQLPNDRVIALHRQASRILAGRVAYGPLDVATDKRDFIKEQLEELDDAAIYGAYDAVKRARVRR